VKSLTEYLKSRWFCSLVNIGLWLLFYLIAMQFRGGTPDFTDAEGYSTPAQSPIPVSEMDNLFSERTIRHSTGANTLDPFYTAYFLPSRKPPPPMATTKKIELTYQGFYESDEAHRSVMVKFENSFIVSAIGQRVVSNLFVAGATMQTLTLTNPAAQTNVLTLNIKRELEVPLK
jgi:hypothetical protein